MYYNCKKFITTDIKTYVPKNIENFLWNILRSFYVNQNLFEVSKHIFSIYPHPKLIDYIIIYHYIDDLKNPKIYTYKNNKITITVKISYKNGYFIMSL